MKDYERVLENIKEIEGVTNAVIRSRNTNLNISYSLKFRIDYDHMKSMSINFDVFPGCCGAVVINNVVIFQAIPNQIIIKVLNKMFPFLARRYSYATFINYRNVDNKFNIILGELGFSKTSSFMNMNTNRFLQFFEKNIRNV